MNDWSRKDIVKEYATYSKNQKQSWYEYGVNFPSMVEMLTQCTRAILDFGCGTGHFASLLQKRFYKGGGV